MSDTHADRDEHDQHADGTNTGETVGPPQAGEQAGESTTRGNGGEGLEESHNSTVEGDDEDDDEDLDALAHPAARAVVTKLRKEAGDTRKKLRETEARTDELAAQLWRYRVAETGLLADPEDLPYDPDALDDPDKVRALAEDLVTRKPHMRSTRIRSRAGQGVGTASEPVSLSAMLKARA